MRKLDKGLHIALRGHEADRALDAFRRQIEEWNMTLPPEQPLVLHFGLGDFNRIGLIEYWIANEIEAGYCGKYFEDPRIMDWLKHVS